LNTVILLEELGVERSRVAVHNWVQKAGLQPVSGESQDRIAVDQKAIRISNERYWLYAAVDPQMNRILHSRPFLLYTIPIARKFSYRVVQKHDVSNAVFLVDNADDLIGTLRRENYNYRVQQHGFSNSVERVFREVERRTSSFSNCFSNAEPVIAET
jgi:putative transposase